jgi:hypothetical protein
MELSGVIMMPGDTTAASRTAVGDEYSSGFTCPPARFVTAGTLADKSSQAPQSNSITGCISIGPNQLPTRVLQNVLQRKCNEPNRRYDNTRFATPLHSATLSAPGSPQLPQLYPPTHPALPRQRPSRAFSSPLPPPAGEFLRECALRSSASPDRRDSAGLMRSPPKFARRDAPLLRRPPLQHTEGVPPRPPRGPLCAAVSIHECTRPKQLGCSTSNSYGRKHINLPVRFPESTIWTRSHAERDNCRATGVHSTAREQPGGAGQTEMSRNWRRPLKPLM